MLYGYMYVHVHLLLWREWERERREREREREREKAVYDTYYMYVLLLSVIVKCTTCVNAYMCIYSECQRRS